MFESVVMTVILVLTALIVVQQYHIYKLHEELQAMQIHIHALKDALIEEGRRKRIKEDNDPNQISKI
mgnify:CR=1 FL=1